MSSSEDSSSVGYCFGSSCECLYCELGIERPPHPPSWKLFIGNVNFRATLEQLWAFFSPCENLKSMKLIKCKFDWTPRRPHRGFGFAKFTSKECALKAIDDFHRKVFMGRRLTVRKDKYTWGSDDDDDE